MLIYFSRCSLWGVSFSFCYHCCATLFGLNPPLQGHRTESSNTVPTSLPWASQNGSLLYWACFSTWYIAWLSTVSTAQPTPVNPSTYILPSFSPIQPSQTLQPNALATTTTPIQPSHLMATQSKNNITKPKTFTDDTIHYPTLMLFLLMVFAPLNPLTTILLLKILSGMKLWIWNLMLC